MEASDPRYRRTVVGTIRRSTILRVPPPMDVTKPYRFIRFGAMDVTRSYKFNKIGAMDVTKPYEFTRFGAMDVTKPYELKSLGPRVSPNPIHL